MDYVRVPFTDEKAPKEADCELLAQRCWAIAGWQQQQQQNDEGVGGDGAEEGQKQRRPPAIVFNCQMGRGRTTTGMVIASMILLRRMMRDTPGAVH